MDRENTQNGDAGQLQGLTRRQVLKNAAGAGMLLLLPMFPAYAADQWVLAGKTADFAANQPKRVALPGGGVVFVTRLSADTLSVVSAKCTHKGCEVAWQSADTQFVCPCHGAVFAADGKNVHGPRRRPDESLPALPPIPVRQKDGKVEVNLGAVSPGVVVPDGGH
jgi:Rieske Fe-S protein